MIYSVEIANVFMYLTIFEINDNEVFHVSDPSVCMRQGDYYTEDTESH